MVIALLAAGCDDAGEAELDRLLPGPCSATRHAKSSDDIELECGMEYDDVDRLATMTCSLFEGAEWWQLTRAFTGDELTEVTWTYELRPEPGMADRDEAETWTLGETVTRTTLVADDEPGDLEVVATYEGQGFRFLGHPFDPEQRPEAPDALSPRSPPARTTPRRSTRRSTTPTAGRRARGRARAPARTAPSSSFATTPPGGCPSNQELWIS